MSSPTEIDEQIMEARLETAVSLAISPSEKPSPITQTTIAQAICRSQNGGGKSCLCERHVWRSCHAAQCYGDMAFAVLTLLKRAKR